jgi:hypothetical protein
MDPSPLSWWSARRPRKPTASGRDGSSDEAEGTGGDLEGITSRAEAIADSPKGSQMDARGIAGDLRDIAGGPEGFAGSRDSLERKPDAPRWSPASTAEKREVIARDRDLPAWKSRVTREDRDLPAWKSKVTREDRDLPPWNRRPVKRDRDSSTWKRDPAPWNRDLPPWNRRPVKRDRGLPEWKSTSKPRAGAGREEDRAPKSWQCDSRPRERDGSRETRDYSRETASHSEEPSQAKSPTGGALERVAQRPQKDLPHPSELGGRRLGQSGRMGGRHERPLDLHGIESQPRAPRVHYGPLRHPEPRYPSCRSWGVLIRQASPRHRPPSDSVLQAIHGIRSTGVPRGVLQPELGRVGSEARVLRGARGSGRPIPTVG